MLFENFVAIDYLAVFIAAASSFFLGGVWYSAKGFLPAWNRATGNLAGPKMGHPAMVFGLSFLAALVAATLFAAVVGTTPSSGRNLLSGVVIGLGFVATTFGINYLFSGKPLALWLIDAGYHVIQFTLFGVVYELWY